MEIFNYLCASQPWTVFCGLKFLIHLNEWMILPPNSTNIYRNLPCARHCPRQFIYSASSYLIPSICQAFCQGLAFPSHRIFDSSPQRNLGNVSDLYLLPVETWASCSPVCGVFKSHSKAESKLI